MSKPTAKLLLTCLLLITWLLRWWRLEIPSAYVFDEVYHVPAIRAISQGNRAAYDPFAKAPEENTAYDWLHPPLAKLFQATAVRLVGDNSFGWRLGAAVFGTASVGSLYFLALTLFKNRRLALLAAAFFAFDNLQLTMSRIAMNDVFVTTWILLALAFFYRRQLLLTGIFTGLALATKHSAIFLYPVFMVFLLPDFIKKFSFKKLIQYIYIFGLLPLAIYLLSYGQLLLLGGNLTDFINLHKQIYWYQTHLDATHGYQSAAWQWPLLVRPVWFYVEYFKTTARNIYNLGNPVIFWSSLVTLLFCRHKFLLAAYFSLFAWLIFSPRIMFFHHYLPALALVCIILARAVNQLSKKTIIAIMFIIIASFSFFYPINTAIELPQNLLKYWFWLPTWR